MNHSTNLKFLILIFVPLLINEIAYSQTKQNVRIHGNISMLPDNVNLYLVTEEALKKSDTVLMTKVKNQKFSFDATNVDIGKMYFVLIDTTVFKFPKRSNNWIRFIVDSNLIEINGSMAQWPFVEIGGSNSTVVYEEYHKSAKLYRDSIRSYENSTKSDSFKLIRLVKSYEFFALNYFKVHRNSQATPLLVLKSPIFNPYQKKELYSGLPFKTRDSYYGRMLFKEIPVLIAKSQVQIGRQIPDFKVENEVGEIVSIKEISGKYKYTLLDFWAYWCSPCKADIPYIKNSYDSFRKSGFNVVSISIDPDRSAWKKALSELNTQWVNLIDVKGISKKLFSINGIPAYILINEKSEIVATDIPNLNNRAELLNRSEKLPKSLRGEMLYKEIEQLLK